MPLDMKGGDVGGVASPKKVPARLPDGYLGALLQIDLLRPVAPLQNFVNCYDRSGNNLSTVTVNPNTSPSRIPKRAAFNSYTYPSRQLVSLPFKSQLCILGELTIMCVVSMSNYKSEGNESYVVQHGIWSTSNVNGAANYTIGVGPVGPGGPTLFYYCEWDNGGSKAGASWSTPNLPELSDGAHHFVCLRRNAAATQVSFDMDDQHYDSPNTLHAPSRGEAGTLQIGGANTSPNSLFVPGSEEELNMWGRSLTNAEVAGCRRIIMGL